MGGGWLLCFTLCSLQLAFFLFLFLVGTFGGALNSVAGGGSFLGLPALMLGGVTPVAANATATLAFWPGTLSSAFAYRRDVAASRGQVLPLAAISFVGGLLGALLLVRTSDTGFLRLLPWLMLTAAVAFTVGPWLTARHRRQTPPGAAVPWPMLLVQLLIAIYGGYFGGGMGIMMLAMMALVGMTDIHEMNGLKTTLATVLNAVALAEFVIARAVAWTPGVVMMSGAILGGYAGASFARRIDRGHVRRFVIVIAWSMTIYFFVR